MADHLPRHRWPGRDRLATCAGGVHWPRQSSFAVLSVRRLLGRVSLPGPQLGRREDALADLALHLAGNPGGRCDRERCHRGGGVMGALPSPARFDDRALTQRRSLPDPVVDCAGWRLVLPRIAAHLRGIPFRCRRVRGTGDHPGVAARLVDTRDSSGCRARIDRCRVVAGRRESHCLQRARGDVDDHDPLPGPCRIQVGLPGG